MPKRREDVLARVRLLAALLSKVAHRGLPALTSPSVERAVLREAARAGLLRFVEKESQAEISFEIHESAPNLKDLLRAALVRELLVNRSDATTLVERSFALTESRAERRFFERLCSSLGDPRLALFVTPQRTFESLGISASATITPVDRVDFAVDLDLDQRVRYIVEVDDSHVGAQRVQDRNRDSAAEASGWRTLRVRSDDPSGFRAAADGLAEAMRKAIGNRLDVIDRFSALDSSARKALLALVAVPVAEAQLLSTAARLLDRTGRVDLIIDDAEEIGIAPAVDAVNRLLECYEDLIDVSPVGRCEQGKGANALRWFYRPHAALTDDQHIALAPVPVCGERLEPLLGVEPEPLRNLIEKAESLKALLQVLFRKRDFRECQIEIISRVAAREETVGLLPTGAGKSLCYQLASFLMPGTTLVVEPIRSLIHDQKQNLNALGIHTVVDFSVEDLQDRDHTVRQKKLAAVASKRAAFVLVAPERLHIPEFRVALQSLTSRVPISLATIDEAHCVSEWGHSFRPAYLNVGRILRHDFRYRGSSPVLLGLTGTASSHVLADLVRELGIDDHADIDTVVVEPREFDRPNLLFEVRRVAPSDRFREVKRIVEEEAPRLTGTANALVFSQFATGKLGVGTIRSELEKSRRLAALPMGEFASTQEKENTIPAGEFEARKRATQDAFKDGAVKVLVCTSAFGMGIDKPDVRLAVHTLMPTSVEDYYQQAGRAGRDGLPSRCVLLFADVDDERIDECLANPDSANPNRRYSSDAGRNLYFITQTFRGRELDAQIASSLVDRLDRCRTAGAGPLEINFGDSVGGDPFDERQRRIETALYRLQSVGVVTSYETDYSRRKFIVVPSLESVGHIRAAFTRWLRGRYAEAEAERRLADIPDTGWRDVAHAAVRQVISHAYDVIRRRRFRQMKNLLDAARASVGAPDEFRRRLLLHLQHSDYTRLVRRSGRDEADNWIEILRMTDGKPSELELLEGACRRQLEDSPDHAGLLLLLALSRMREGGCPDQAEIDGAVGAIVKALVPARRAELFEALLVTFLDPYAREGVDPFLHAVARFDPDRRVLRICYREAPRYSRAEQVALMAIGESILRSLHE